MTTIENARQTAPPSLRPTALHLAPSPAGASYRPTTRLQWSRQGQEALDHSPGLVTSSDPAAFRSRGVRWTFDDIVVSDTVQTPCLIAPTNDDESGDSEYVSALFVLAGGYRVAGGGQQLPFAKGAAGWMPGWTRVHAENPHTSRLARVSVPRDSLAGVERLHRAVGLFEKPMMLTTPALAFVLELMHATDERSMNMLHPTNETHAGHPAAAVLSQLVMGLFLEQAGYRTDSVELTSGLWAKAVTVIDRHFADPGLDPIAVAGRLHVSLRHLQRAFAQNGSTISDAIRERRVTAVVTTMTGGTSPYLGLSEVAAMSGFSSIKEMRFALRSKHGMTPREFRSTSLAAAG